MSLKIEIAIALEAAAQALRDLAQTEPLTAKVEAGTSSAPDDIDPVETANLQKSLDSAPQHTLQLDSNATLAGERHIMVDVDADNLPWDERIHASTKTKNKDGTWRALRGVDPDILARVTAELKGVMGAKVEPTGDAPAAPPIPPAPPAPEIPLATNDEYSQLVDLIASHKGGLTPEWVNRVVAYCGAPGGTLQSIANNPELVTAVHTYIKENVK